jgi:hypothetical protein
MGGTKIESAPLYLTSSTNRPGACIVNGAIDDAGEGGFKKFAKIYAEEFRENFRR